MYGSGVKLIVGGVNGSAVGTSATDGWALEPDFSERATWLYLTWATACFFLLSCLFHLGNALLWKKVYLHSLASGYAVRPCPTPTAPCATAHATQGAPPHSSSLVARLSTPQPFRWIEYSFSASVMILILAYTSGTTTLL